MQTYLTRPDGIADLAIKAALSESFPEKWEARFRSLLESGAIKISMSPGSEFALHIHVRDRFVPPALLAENFLRYLLPTLQTGCSVGIDLSNVAAAGFNDWLAEFSRVMAAGLAAINFSSGSLLFSMSIDHPGLMSFLQLRGRQDLGYPNVAVRYGASVSHFSGATWEALTTFSHADERIKPVPVLAARPLTALHATESGQCVMPRSLFEVRANTAWMVLQIDASLLSMPVFPRSQLGLCLRFADNLIDAQQWALPALRLDALLNRRIALHVGKLGQMVANAGLNPQSFGTLKYLQRWLWLVRKSFIRESNKLARARGSFPALRAAEIVDSLTPCYGVADARRLVRVRSVRNRNLLALSPFSIFPDGASGTIDESWLNLLPAIGCADNLSMFGNDTRKNLRLGTWSRMLQMTGSLAAGSGDYAQCYLG